MRNLVDFLFDETQNADALDADGIFLDEDLDGLYQKLCEQESQSIETKKTPLSKALKAMGIEGEIELDPSGLALTVDDGNVYNSILNLLRGPDEMHKLAEMGWVTSAAGEQTQNSEIPEFKVRFIEISVCGSTDSDSEVNQEKIAQDAIEFATEPMDRDDELNPVENDGKEPTPSIDKGVGKATDGEKATMSKKSKK